MVAFRKAFKEAKTCQGTNYWFCGDFTIMYQHIKLAETSHNNGTAWKVCGKMNIPNELSVVTIYISCPEEWN